MKYITGFLMFLWDFVGGVDSPELTAAAAILIVCARNASTPPEP